jgi:acyl-CoA synthetase (AMP-forming)/AMP-acid ligase II
MILYNEIAKNTSLRFLDEHQPNESFALTDLNLFDLPTENKRLAFLYIDNSITAITVLLSFLKSTHALVLLSPALSDTLKIELEEHYKPTYIYDTTRTNIDGYKSNIATGLWQNVGEVDYAIHPEIKVLLSTSGTTGSPKFVKLSEANLWSNAISIASYLPINDADVAPLNLPVYYSYGLSVFTSNAIKGGAIVCTNTDVLSKIFWDQMQHFGFTSIAGVPFVYEMLNRIGFTKKQYPSLKYFTQAGGRLQEPLVIKFAAYAKENDLSFYVMYGQTEATARMSYLPPTETFLKATSIGIAIPGGKFEIEAETNELKYQGENVFGGYVTSLQDLESYEQEPWLHTGDQAKMDADGFVYITGRMKRFVKLFGNRINLDEVESILAKQLNTMVYTIGVEDKSMLLIGTDESILKHGAAYVVKELKLHPTVVKTFVCDTVPLTANGKPDYKNLQKMYEGL